jgi:hypothetical protein
MRTEGPVAVQ